MPFPAELKLHILSMIDDPKQRKCRSIVSACHSDTRNRDLCAQNISSLWELAGFDSSIQPKNLTTFAHQCYRDTHRVLQCVHDLLLSVQEYEVQDAISKSSWDSAKPHYYYKFLTNMPSLKDVKVFPNDIMDETELVDIAKSIKTRMANIVALCESDEWLSFKFVLDEDDDEDDRDEADVEHLNTIRDFVKSTSDFYLYDHARALSSAFCGLQDLIDKLIRFLYGDGN
jgi:hypothetical protein